MSFLKVCACVCVYIVFFIQTLILKELTKIDTDYIGTICGSYRRGKIITDDRLLIVQTLEFMTSSHLLIISRCCLEWWYWYFADPPKLHLWDCKAGKMSFHCCHLSLIVFIFYNLFYILFFQPKLLHAVVEHLESIGFVTDTLSKGDTKFMVWHSLMYSHAQQ